MSFLDELSGKLNKLSDKLKETDISGKINEVGNSFADALSVGAKTAYGRAKNAAEVGGLKMKLADAEKEAASAYEKFGRKYLELRGDDPDPELAGEIAAIGEAEKKVAELKKGIEDAKAAVAAAEAEMKEKAQAAREARKTTDEGDEFSEEETSEFTEEAPEEETPAEEAPAEEASAEEAPAENAPEEEAPAEDAPAEETPAEDAPAEETPAEDAPTEDKNE